MSNSIYGAVNATEKFVKELESQLQYRKALEEDGIEELSVKSIDIGIRTALGSFLSDLGSGKYGIDRRDARKVVAISYVPGVKASSGAYLFFENSIRIEYLYLYRVIKNGKLQEDKVREEFPDIFDQFEMNLSIKSQNEIINAFIYDFDRWYDLYSDKDAEDCEAFIGLYYPGCSEDIEYDLGE